MSPSESQLRVHRAGAGEGTRTHNLRITNPMLYQLSYASQEKRAADYRPASSPLASAWNRPGSTPSPRSMADYVIPAGFASLASARRSRS